MENGHNALTTRALKGMPAHLERAEGLVFGRSAIDYLLLNVPPACNYACEKCFTWANTHKITDFLSTDEVLSLVDQGHALGAKVVCIIGEGEPPLYLQKLRSKVDFLRIVERISELGMITIMATNGSLLDEETVDFCYRNNVSLVVSVDTLDAAEYRAFYRGAADLDKVLLNLAHARKVYAQDNYTRNGVSVYRLAVHMTVSTKNYHEIGQIRDFCGEDMYFDCDHVAPVGIAIDNPGILGNGDSVQYDLCVRASRNATVPMVQTRASCGKEACSLFYYGLAIGYEGEVMIDTHAVETKYIVGHVREAPLTELLKKAQSYRDLYFERFGDHPCIIRNPRYREYLATVRQSAAREHGFEDHDRKILAVLNR
jgi:MoaA/NifB/PqqE/SkfB family radical SAM enzyme